VLEIARGRIWSGEDALALGLVDELGGISTALRLLKREAGIPEDEDVELVVYPRPKGLLEQLLQGGGQKSENLAAAATLRALETVRPLARELDAAFLRGEPGVLAMPSLVLEP
jgi:protease-4